MSLSDDEIRELAQQLVLNRIEDLLEGLEVNEHVDSHEDARRVANAIESIRDILVDQFAERRYELDDDLENTDAE